MLTVKLMLNLLTLKPMLNQMTLKHILILPNVASFTLDSLTASIQ